MKLLHLADLHLGKRVNGFEMLEDQRALLEQVVDLCDARGVQAVALAGDLYDTPLPPAGAVLLLDWFLTRLAERGIAVLAVSGNHDSAERLDFGAGLLAREKVHIAGRFTGQLTRVELADEFGSVEFCLLPFVRAATVRHFLPEAPITDYDTAVAAALATLPPAQSSTRRVLLAHQMVVSGSRTPQAAGSESCAPALAVGTVEAVEAARFAGFGYVALGHIHRPQAVGSDWVRYSGAPLCYSLDECGAEKSAVLVSFGAGPVPELELIPLHPRRAMRKIEGTLDQLTAHRPETGAEDYIWARLEDPTPLPDAMARLRAVYPNAMKLDYKALGPGPDLRPGAGPGPDIRAFEPLFDRFFQQLHGRPMTDEEQAALDAMWQEVTR